MKLYEMHQAIEQLGLREHGDKELVVDMDDGRYAPAKKLEVIGPSITGSTHTKSEVVIRIR